jgi:hypothetical protein
MTARSSESLRPDNTPSRASKRRVNVWTLLLTAAFTATTAAECIAGYAEPLSAESHPQQRPSDEEPRVAVPATALAEGLIVGLDGELYEPYLPATIERVQVGLRTRGLYDGPVNGILDAPTMRAIYEFQEASYGLQRCGVPTPRTRRLLEQGSHTP